jgi:uncharacterized protein (DUF1778 family)
MSPKEKRLQVRLSQEEFDRLHEAAQKEGYKTVSAFIRSVTIGDKKGILLKIQDDVKKILEKLEKK